MFITMYSKSKIRMEALMIIFFEDAVNTAIANLNILKMGILLAF